MFLYTIIVYPVQQILEGCWLIFDQLTGSAGIAVLGVSLAVSLLCLPLYTAAEACQERERRLNLEMENGIRRIKRTFCGDERYMILATFYRQHHYHPVMSLRSSFGLLVQIPFFVAAWMFLSHLPQLQGTPFFCIPDLGKPDALVGIGTVRINILPVLMTFFNVMSGLVYTKGHGLREKIQMAVLAGVFFFLLYNISSALLLYWTANNVFSFVKNSCCKPAPEDMASGGSGSGKYFVLFTVCCCAMWILCGIALPSCVIASAPEEFSNIDTYTTPLYFLFNSLLQSGGFFLFWPMCLYFLYRTKARNILVFSAMAVLFCSLADSFIFPSYYGTLTAGFVFDDWKTDIVSGSANVIVLVVIFIVFHFIFRRHISTVTTLSVVVCMALLFLSLLNVVRIQAGYKKLPERRSVTEATIVPVYSLSTQHRNVVVLFLDRFTSAFFPAVMEECPELKADYSGFVYYPDTISYGMHTIVGAPALLGGYEYRPEQINARKNELLQKKIDEAVSVLPRLFGSAGFSVIFANPCGTDASPGFLSSLPSVRTPETNGIYRNLWYRRHEKKILPVRSAILKRDLIRLSFFKCAPVLLRSVLYWHDWWEIRKLNDTSSFVDAYAALDFLPELTDFTANRSVFLFIHNMLPHEAMFLDAPDFTLPPSDAPLVEKSVSRFAGLPDYYSAAASIRLVARWLLYLKKHGCYDNTRIIIVADHGARLSTGRFSRNTVCPSADACNPLLLVKDFDRNGVLETDGRFMTQADVPFLAAGNIIEHPVNPSTGRPLGMNDKSGIQKLFMNHLSSVRRGETVFKTQPSDWYTVHDSIFDLANWGKPEK
jgi:hypothetical protein